MLKDFKTFILRGNVLDLAVAVIIGGAFGKIISSLVNDILMPPLGLLLRGVDLSNLFLDLSGKGYTALAEAQAAGAATLNYGLFLNNIIDFLVIAFVIYLMVRLANRLTAGKPTPPPATKDCPFCCSAIALQATRCPHCTSELKK